MKFKFSSKKFFLVLIIICLLSFKLTGNGVAVHASDLNLVNKSGEIAKNDTESFDFSVEHHSNIKIQFSLTYGTGFDVLIYDNSNNVVFSQLDNNVYYKDLTLSTSLDKGNYRLCINANDSILGLDYNVKLTASRIASTSDPIYSLNTSNKSLKIGETTTLAIKADPSDGITPSVVWESDDEKIATISSEGVVKAISSGTAIISANIGTDVLTCKITVESPTISYTELTLYAGKSKTLVVTKNQGKVKWSSSSTSVATVSSEGKVTAKKKGTATITATVDGVKLTCNVEVKNASISKTKLTMNTGDAETLLINGASGTITWKSSNKTIATVSSKGKVTAKGVGSATISGTVSGKTYKCVVKVVSSKPDFTVFLSSKTDSSTSLILLEITNNGPKTLTITASDSYLVDKDYDEYNRALYLADPYNSFKKITSVKIGPGKTADVCFLINGKESWYDNKTTITYTVKYDGKSYVYGSSSYYGTGFLIE